MAFSNEVLHRTSVESENIAPFFRVVSLVIVGILTMLAVGFPYSDVGAIVSAAHLFAGP